MIRESSVKFLLVISRWITFPLSTFESRHSITTVSHLQHNMHGWAGAGLVIVTGCNPNDLDIWTDWCRLRLQFVVYKSAEQEWSFVN